MNSFYHSRIQLIRKFIAPIAFVNEESVSFFETLLKWIYFPIILDVIVFSALSRYLV